MDLISVIVPVYKVEQYLDKCIQSIVNQTYRNLEIILVDDGSPDRCGEICNEWAAKDDRIVVIHQKNAGGAAARNAGLNIAAGDLIAFVDSDDCISPTMYERLSDVLCKTGADIAECNYLYVWDDDAPAPECHGEARLFSTKDALRSNLYNTACQTVVWNKLYRKQVVAPVRFVEGKIIDDEFFTYRVIGNASSVAVIDDCLYFYRQHSQSVMHQAYSLDRLVVLEASALRCEYVSARFPELAPDARISFWMTCMYNYQMIRLHMQGRELCHAEHRFEELTGCRELYWSDLKNIRGHIRLWLSLSKLNFKLTCRLRNLFGIGH